MLWSIAVVAVGLALAVPGARRYLLRRRAVTRARTELAWFYQRRPERERFTPGSGKHASTVPVVVLRRVDGTPLGHVPRPR
ncbi:hypothetical protein SAMN02982929_06853 [Saccharopolyspora kobensis]|uniref:Uncharacterized protein n=1 Tax=Saccharopolyspora kobensis TaxID=146035 RepID=A0A1H6EKJ9_9PSEU|nr:hypothetical protein [Saccharopolyspora kobensis]SEG97651.1 hypothetical protein SAMN02982929_06853 [Saccharopolyspora kobensis]SFE92426.1 hypothetical protein SAMN05216506_11610 [Saccharopolyspora kobensis]